RVSLRPWKNRRARSGLAVGAGRSRACWIPAWQGLRKILQIQRPNPWWEKVMKNLTIAALAAATLAVPASAMQAQAPAPTRAAPDVVAGRMMIYNQTTFNGGDYEVDAAKRMFEWDYHPSSIGTHPGTRRTRRSRP